MGIKRLKKAPGDHLDKPEEAYFTRIESSLKQDDKMSLLLAKNLLA